MAFTSGTYAIGSLAAFNALSASVQALFAGRYDTFKLAEADMGVNMTGNITLTAISTTDEAGGTNFDIGSGVGGFTLKLNCISNHGGDPTFNIITEISTNDRLFQFSTAGSATDINYEIDGLYMKSTANPINCPIFINLSFQGSGAIGVSFVIKNCLMNGNLKCIDGIVLPIGAGGLPAPLRIHVYNNKIWGITRDGMNYLGGGTGFCQSRIENNTFFVQPGNGRYGIFVGAGWNSGFFDEAPFIRNNVICNFATECYHVLDKGGNPDDSRAFGFYNNACTDVFAYSANCREVSGVINNINPSQEFQSLVETNPKFLFLKDGIISPDFTADQLIGKASLKVQFRPTLSYRDGTIELGANGTIPTYATTDIAGLSKPGDDNEYSIGCHEEHFAMV